jgi:hydroxymethylpyrimidine pyrophosphatase-like HAD family hydrolase
MMRRGRTRPHQGPPADRAAGTRLASDDPSMRYGVLAIDYDGTLSEDGRLTPDVRAALDEVRACRVAVVLVTGRILTELRQLAGALDFADAVVAENGAVLSFPATGRTVALHSPPDPAFLVELKRRGVALKAGECVVETAADDAAVALEVLRRLELPLVLAFNRGRVMVLPQAVSKATGLREALTTLRLSVHNTLAIGDAENDHELLAAAEVGVAVAWGSPALQRHADLVLAGTSPAAVPGFLRSLCGQRQLGHTDGDQPLALAVRDRNVLVTGDPRSGKSWVAGLLCEQLMLARYCVCVIDPEGDYRTLEALPAVRVVGDAGLPTPADLERAFRFPDGSLVIDLSHVDHARKVEYLATLLPALAALRARTGLPHRVVLDEAHYFLADGHATAGLDLASGGYTFVTYRPSQLDAAVRADLGPIVATRHSDPRDLEALVALCGGAAPDLAATLGSLSVSEAVLLPTATEAHGAAVRFTVAPRLTPHVRHRHKYADLPVPLSRRFVFTAAPGRPAAASLAGFAAMLEQIAPADLDWHLRHHDFSRWVGGVFGDHTLARDLAAVETAHVMGQAVDPPGTIVAAIRRRYDLKGEPA